MDHLSSLEFSLIGWADFVRMADAMENGEPFNIGNIAKQHAFFLCPLGEKMKYIIELALKAIGQDQLQVPVIVDLTPQLLCRYSSKATLNDIDSVIRSMEQCGKITSLPEEAKPKFTLHDRISGWTVNLKPRSDGKREAFFKHHLQRKKFRSTIEVLHYILYEEDKQKPQVKRKMKIIKKIVLADIEKNLLGC